MAKKVAVLALDPVNGMGLFQYLEAFYENAIPYRVFAVAEGKQIKTNSGIEITVDDVIGSLRGSSEQYDALVFACGDAVPKFSENAQKQYNVDMLEVIKEFAQKDKMMIGHCAAGMMYDIAGVAQGRRVAVHPMAKGAVKNAVATDEKFEVDANYYTAQTEESIWMMMPEVLKALK